MVLEYLNTENGTRKKQIISSKHIDEIVLIFFINTNIFDWSNHVKQRSISFESEKKMTWGLGNVPGMSIKETHDRSWSDSL